MVPEPSFESMCFNLFLSNDSINDSNQNPDVNFHNDISSLETSYLSPSELDKNFQNFSKLFCSLSKHEKYEQKIRGLSRFLQVPKHQI